MERKEIEEIERFKGNFSLKKSLKSSLWEVNTHPWSTHSIENPILDVVGRRMLNRMSLFDLYSFLQVISSQCYILTKVQRSYWLRHCYDWVRPHKYRCSNTNSLYYTTDSSALLIPRSQRWNHRLNMCFLTSRLPQDDRKTLQSVSRSSAIGTGGRVCVMLKLMRWHREIGSILVGWSGGQSTLILCKLETD